MEFTGENQIYEALFALTNAALSGESPEVAAGSRTDYKAMYAAALKHTVITELESVFSELPLNEEEAGLYENCILSELRKFGQIRDEQKRIFEAFSRENIRYVVLKGFAASMYYPKPYQRMHGDVDLLLTAEDTERAAKLLEADGYERKHDPHNRHEEMTKGGFSVELHLRYSDEENDTFGPEIDALLSEGMNRAV